MLNVLGARRGRKAMHTNEAPLHLVGGPIPVAWPSVLLRLRIGKIEFPVNVMPDRAILIPEWVPQPERTRASMHAAQFERGHRVVIHELLKRARESIRAEAVISTSTLKIVEPPTLGDKGELIFRMECEGEELVLHISALLAPSQFHVDQDSKCNMGQLFAAYDTALDYMQERLNDIEQNGFDTTVLRMSMRGWEGYRERMRIV